MLSRIEAFARRQPDAAAVSGKEEIISYGALWERAQRRADDLLRQGTAPVLLLDNGAADVFVSLVACLIAGRTYVPVRPDTPQQRLQTIAALSGATLALTDLPLPLPGVDCCPAAELSKYGAFPVRHGESSTVYIIFTSGSTGEPKGVPISRGNLESFLRWMCRLAPLRDLRQCRVLHQANLSFDLSVADVYYTLCGGHTLVLPDPAHATDCEEIFSTLRAQAVQVAVLTPTFAQLCLLHPAFNAEHLPALRCIYLCGERLESSLAQRLLKAFPRLDLLNAYGPTEATSAVSAIRITPALLAAEPVLPVGTTDNLATPVRIEDGEIVLAGDSVFSGYLGGVTGGYREAHGERSYHTGDLGTIRDGKLYCLGRRDDQIKFNGYRIEPGEIEAQLNAIDGVQGAAVLARKTPQGTVKMLQAFVVLQDDMTIQQVRAALKTRLPAYMIPKSIRALPELPVNENGKIDRKVLTTL